MFETGSENLDAAGMHYYKSYKKAKSNGT